MLRCRGGVAIGIGAVPAAPIANAESAQSIFKTYLGGSDGRRASRLASSPCAPMASRGGNTSMSDPAASLAMPGGAASMPG